MYVFKKFHRLALLVAAFAFSACVTHKKKGEISDLARFYHNTTAKYNGYFNANVILNEAIQVLEQNYKDNYNHLLPIFPYNAADNADQVKSRLDKAIEKVSTVITLHRVSRWTDDCYLLLGKAQYLKKDYETAENSFRFFLEEFNPLKNKVHAKKIKENSAKAKKKEREKLKKTKAKLSKEKAKAREKAQREKKKEIARKKKAAKKKAAGSSAKNNTGNTKNAKPASSVKSSDTDIKELTTKKKDKNINKDLILDGNRIVPHIFAYWEGAIWAGKNLIERGKHYEAGQIFKEIEADPLTPEKHKEELFASHADLLIKSQQQQKAIPYLKKALAYAKDKKRKARYAYILGQIYQKLNRIPSSTEHFEMVIKLRPAYDMVFHAKMNTLLNEGLSGGTHSEVIAGLELLLKDPKNQDYASALYYTIALIQLQNNQRARAAELLTQAVQAPAASSSQKADGYYKLAHLKLEDQDYQLAKYYFDSTYSNLSKTDERRPEVSNMVSNLAELAKQLEIIALQDSLIRVSKMSVKQKRDLAIQIKNANKAKVSLPENPKIGMGRNPRMAGFEEIPGYSFGNPMAEAIREVKPAPKSGGFFAYDQRAINRGRSEFEQQWGTRENEDHWRRKNKISFATVGDQTATNRVEEKEVLEPDLAEMLRGVPTTDAEVEECRKKIHDAMLLLGTLYRDKIQNYGKSSQTLTALLKEFPGTDRKADVFYYLYLNCLDLNDAACANAYAQKIVDEFPDTRYGKVLSDPEYAKTISRKKDEIEQTYVAAYNLYVSSDFKAALALLVGLQQQMANKPHPLQAKVALLAALCTGHSDDKESYVSALRDVVANFPSTPEEVKAKEILRFLRGDRDAFIEVTEAEMEEANFKLEKNTLHYVVVQLFQPEEKVKNRIKISISDYNQNYHKSENLKMSDVELDIENNESLILIKKFDNAEMAMKYYHGIFRKPEEFIKGFDRYEIYVLSRTNYLEILKIKRFKEYAVFFKKNYLEQN